MKPKLFLRSPSFPALVLESIDERHLEALRVAKNSHAGRFFHQAEISTGAQLHWYHGYCQRQQDWMFVIRHHQSELACIGFRLEDGCVDLYNLLRFPGAGGGLNAVAAGLDLLCAYVATLTPLPIRGRLLADNPALRWCSKRGFVIVDGGERDGLAFRVMELDRARMVHHPVTVETADTLAVWSAAP